MKNLFKNISASQFETSFTTDLDCLAFLAEQKWQTGYSCRKCGHTNFCKGKTPYSRRCTRCKHEESATAHTVFHRCKVKLPDAFHLAYRVCSKPDISTYELARELETRQMTCWKLKKKILECLEEQGTATEGEQ